MHVPTGAARWFNRLDQDYSTSTDSRVQTLDFATTEDSSLYSWWIRNTKPKHPVLVDPREQLMSQIGGTMDWPEVIVADCEGKVTYRKQGDLDESRYRELRQAIDDALNLPHCNPD